MSFAHSGSILVCLALTWIADGQFNTAQKAQNRNMFNFKLSNGAELRQVGKSVRDVNGYVTETVNEIVENSTFPCTPYLTGCVPKMDQVLESLTKNYDKQIRPGIQENRTQVSVDLYIRGLLEIDEVEMEFKLSVALTLDWFDKRLRVNRGSYPSNYVFPERVLVDEKQAENVWTPRVTVLNEKESVKNSDIFHRGSFVWYPNSGALTLTTYGILTLTCYMSLQNFPMDTQICRVMVGSNVFGNDEIDLTGNLNLDPLFSNFVANMELVHYGQYRFVAETAGPRDVNKTVLVCALLVKRLMGYYLICTYFPSVLVVIISWLTFWMPREGSAKRMALGVTCVLTITTLLISSESNSPKVSYVKAIDIYMVFCFALIFATLLHSTLIGYLLCKAVISDRRKSLLGDDEKGAGLKEYNPKLAWIIKRIMGDKLEMEDTAQILKLAKLSDAWSRVLFPLVFVIFNVVYWAYYISVWNGSSIGESRN